MFQRKNKKTLIIAILILALVTLSLGYAMLTQNLKINGNAEISKNTWDIYFDNVVEKDSTATINNNAVIHESLQSDGKTAPNTWIDYNITLNKPTDKYDFIVDIVNDGSIDAIIDDVRLTGIEDINNYVTYTVKYLDGTDVKKCDLLKAESRRKVRVVTTFKEVDDESELPGELKTSDIKFQIDYIQSTNTCTRPSDDSEEEETITPTDSTQRHKLTIKPNGGIYGKDTSSETTENIEITLEKGEEYNLLNFVRDGYELVLDLSTIAEYTESSRIITMGESDIEIKADWNIVDLSNVVAKNVTTSKYYPTIKEAFDEAKANEEILLLKDTEESPINNTVPAFKFDLGGFKITGTLTNNGNLTLYNGTIENEEGTGAINTGTLTLGINDETVLVDEAGTIAIIGSATEGIGLQNTGTFNFYDGYLEAKVGLSGSYDLIPIDYYVYVNHNDAKNCQKVHLTQDTTRAVAKTVVDGLDLLYFNLQDAFNSGMEDDLDVYAIRDFEASYELHVDENKELLFNLAGWTVRPGNDITNNGTFTITDTGRDGLDEEEQPITIKGELMPSKTITNTGTLNITDVKVTETTNANIITNTGNIELNGTTITATTGYIIYNNGDTSITGNELNTISTNNYIIYNNSGNLIVSINASATATGIIYNLDKVTINGGNISNTLSTVNSIYGIYNNGSKASAIINDGKLSISNSNTSNGYCYGIYNDSNQRIEQNGGEINVSGFNATGIRSYNGSLTMNDGKVIVNGNYDVYGLFGNIVMNDGIVEVSGVGGYESGAIGSGSYTVNGGTIRSLVTSAGYQRNNGALLGMGTVNNNPTIESTQVCISSRNDVNVTINGGTYTCGTKGVYLTNGKLYFNDGNINSVDEAIYLVYSCGWSCSYTSANISGGTIVSKNNYGIYTKANNGVVIGSTTSRPYIEGATNGVYVDKDNSWINIADADIIGKNGYGVYSKVPITIGTNDETVNPNNPTIRGTTYGLYLDDTTANFYDGILKGQIAGYYGTFAGFPDAYSITDGTETIEDEDYLTNYLTAYTNFVKVGETEYNSLNKAIAAIDSEGTMELIASADVTAPVTFPSDKNIVLDLAGYTLNVSKQITTAGTLEIKDESLEKTGTINCSLEKCLNNSGTLTISSGNYFSNNTFINNSGSITIDNGTIEINSDTANNLYGIYNEKNNANVTLNDGLIKVTGVNTVYGIYNSVAGIRFEQNGGEINVNSSSNVYGIESNNGTTIINGGKIYINGINSVYGIRGNVTYNNGIMEITGSGNQYGYAISGNYTINGGTIDFKLTSGGFYGTTNAAITGNGTINNNPTINSTQYCILLDSENVHINGGTYNCDRVGAYIVSGSLVMTDGIMTSNSDDTVYLLYKCGWACSNSSATITGGTIISKAKNGVYTRANSGVVIGSSTSKPYIEGATNGIYVHTDNSWINVIDADIIGKNGYGIYSKKPLTIGKNDETINTTTPTIRGTTYGLYLDETTANFYDGIVYGKEGGYSGSIIGFPDAYTITNGTETIENEEYLTNYLVPYTNFVKVGETEYNSLNKAIAAIDSVGTMELIASADITSTVSIPSDKNITLDLAGYTLNVSKQITNEGTFEIKDDSSGETGTMNFSIEKCFNNQGTFTISGGNYFSNATFISNSGDFILNGGRIDISSEESNNIYGIYNEKSNTNVTINDGLLKIVNSGNAYGLSNGSNVYYISIIQNGGTIDIKGKSAYGFDVTFNSAFQMNGGTIKTDGIEYIIGVNLYTSSSATINDGTIEVIGTGNWNASAVYGNHVINGGTFKVNTLITSGYYGDYGTFAIKGAGTINNNPIIQSSHICVYGTENINGGNFDCGTYGIRPTGTATIKDATFIANNYAIDLKNNYNVNIVSGSFISKDSYAIYQSTGNLTIGTKDKNIDAGNPIIQGSSYGLYKTDGTTNIYDGILKGQTAAYFGTINNIEDNSIIKDDTEIIDENDYFTSYLINETEIVKNNNKSENNIYKNLQTAIDEAESGDVLELIDNASIFYNVTIPEEMTIDLDMNGYSITTTKQIINNGTLNIYDNSSEKTSKINCSLGINLITNNNNMTINDVDVNYTASGGNNYVFTNNGNLNITNSNIAKGNYGIRNNSGGILFLNNDEINANNTAVYNYGELNVNGGTIEGTSYGIYEQSSMNATIDDITIESDNNSLYKYSSSNIMTISDSNLNGRIDNRSGTLNISGSDINGLVNNESTMTIEESDTTNSINNSSNMTLEKVNINNISSSYGGFNSIYTTGVLSITNSTVKVSKSNASTSTSCSSYEILAIRNNGGTLNSNDNNIYVEDTINTSIDNSRLIMYGIKNENSGIITSNNDTIIIRNTRTSYGVYNDSTNINNKFVNLSIENTESYDTYGIYSNKGNITMESGSINTSGVNAYGIYINSQNATINLGIKDGSGLETADVSITYPEVKAIGTTIGVGVKNNNGTFNFYDGKLIGNTYAKPETANEVEPGFEARYFLVHDDDTETEIPFGTEEGKTYKYEYSILEFLK